MAVVQTEKKEVKQKPNFKYLRDKDREMVRGKFIFHEVPGGVMSFCIRIWKEDPIERYDLMDGEIYSLPLGVAKHLNKNCWYPEYEYIKNEGMALGCAATGRESAKTAMYRVAKKVRRCSFQSLEFVDIDDLTPAGSTVLGVEQV